VVKPGQVNAAMAAKDAAKPGGAVNRPATGSIIVNSRQVRFSSPCPILALTGCAEQKGNPIIAHIKNVAWELGDIVPDYQLGGTTGLLFLRFVLSSCRAISPLTCADDSLRYHQLHSEYIHGRIEAMGQSYTLRLMMVMCDVENHQASIRELSKICIVMGYTMIVAWSYVLRPLEPRTRS
jgi:DNA excision repair protein ERCC-1